MKHKKLVYALVTAGFTLSALGGCGVSQPASSAGEDSEKYDFSLFGGDKEGEGSFAGGTFDESSDEVVDKTKEIEELIDSYFYFEQDEDKREESYYDGILKGLDDPYSVYYTESEYEKMMEDDSGEFQGIGATVSKNIDKGTIYIVKPMEDSPAEKAGLLPNDVVVAVDDMAVTSDMELEYVVDHIRGEAGTDVTLKIYREGEYDYLYITITRGTIENKTVKSEMLDNQIGYIQIDQFIDNTDELFIEAIDDMESQGARGLVIDLRDNPGGMLSSVLKMVDYVIDDKSEASGAEKAGLLLQTKDKNDAVMEEYSCTDKHSVELPMVVLVNGNSASASEIFTGCLKDYGVATIVGTTTYGKGIVQSIMKLSDGSAVKLTIAKYFLPSGADIHKVGVEPDVEVELDDSLKQKITIEHDEDNQLQEALRIFE